MIVSGKVIIIIKLDKKIVFMTTESTLQTSHSFTSIHTLMVEANLHICLLQHLGQFGVEHLAQVSITSKVKLSGKKIKDS